MMGFDSEYKSMCRNILEQMYWDEGLDRASKRKKIAYICKRLNFKKEDYEGVEKIIRNFGKDDVISLLEEEFIENCKEEHLVDSERLLVPYLLNLAREHGFEKAKGIPNPFNNGKQYKYRQLRESVIQRHAERRSAERTSNAQGN